MARNGIRNGRFNWSSTKKQFVAADDGVFKFWITPNRWYSDISFKDLNNFLSQDITIGSVGNRTSQIFINEETMLPCINQTSYLSKNHQDANFRTDGSGHVNSFSFVALKFDAESSTKPPSGSIYLKINDNKYIAFSIDRNNFPVAEREDTMKTPIINRASSVDFENSYFNNSTVTNILLESSNTYNNRINWGTFVKLNTSDNQTLLISKTVLDYSSYGSSTSYYPGLTSSPRMLNLALSEDDPEDLIFFKRKLTINSSSLNSEFVCHQYYLAGKNISNYIIPQITYGIDKYNIVSTSLSKIAPIRASDFSDYSFSFSDKDISNTPPPSTSLRPLINTDKYLYYKIINRSSLHGKRLYYTSTGDISGIDRNKYIEIAHGTKNNKPVGGYDSSSYTIIKNKNYTPSIDDFLIDESPDLCAANINKDIVSSGSDQPLKLFPLTNITTAVYKYKNIDKEIVRLSLPNIIGDSIIDGANILTLYVDVQQAKQDIDSLQNYDVVFCTGGILFRAQMGNTSATFFYYNSSNQLKRVNKQIDLYSSNNVPLRNFDLVNCYRTSTLDRGTARFIDLDKAYLKNGAVDSNLADALKNMSPGDPLLIIAKKGFLID